MSYYILRGNDREGPLDLITLIKRVRSGRLKPEDVILEDNGLVSEGLAAITHPDLGDVFREMESQADIVMEPRSNHVFDLGRLVRTSWHFVMDHYSITAFSGVYCLFSLVPILALWGTLPWYGAFIPGAIFQTIGMVIISGLMWMVLRLHRGQPADVESMLHMLSTHKTNLLPLCAMVGVASYVGFLLAAIPGLLILTFSLPAILLVIEHQMHPLEALALSRRKLQEAGIEAVGVAFGLCVVGFVGGLFIVPPIFTLPLALYAYAMIYEEIYTEYR